MPRWSSIWIVGLGSAAALALSAAVAQTPPTASQPLKTPAEFQIISNQTERSRAIFTEIGKVLTHPR